MYATVLTRTIQERTAFCRIKRYAAHMINSKSINSIITEILIRGRKINEIVTKPCFQL